MRFELEYPVKAHGEEVDHFILPDRMKGKHLRGQLTDPTIDDIMDSCARFAKVPPSTIDQMDGVDVIRLLDWHSDFLDPRERPKRRGAARKK